MPCIVVSVLKECFFRLPSLETTTHPIHQSGIFAASRDTLASQLELELPPNRHVERQQSSSSTVPDTLRADDVIMSTSGGDYPPNIAISPGSCKSPYCCTSPGFCNFPFHKFKMSHCATPSSRDVIHDVLSKTKSDPFVREQVFVPDLADPEHIEQLAPAVTRRFSVPSSHDPFPIIKPDQLSLPGISDHDEIIDAIAPMTSLSSSSSSSLSSSVSSIDNLLSDVTNSDVMGLLRSPKMEVIETNSPFEFVHSDVPVIKSPAFSGSTIRRSPPPPNITLSPDKHKRTSIPQGKLNLCFTLFQ